MNEQKDHDDNLFRQSLEGVTPLKPSGRVAHSKLPAKVLPRLSSAPGSVVADTLSDHGAADIPADNYLSDGLSRMTLRKLRRGIWPPQDSLDLHGLSIDAARRLLVDFLHNATQRGLSCVNVIHGKGWRSEGREGVLKIHTRHWLTQHPQVLAFCEAPQNAGGGGAVWVLLKKLSG